MFPLQLTSSSFSYPLINYDKVENLKLDRNLLEKIPEEIMDIKLTRGFSARFNKLQTVRKKKDFLP